jgi:hypothetical protein
MIIESTKPEESTNPPLLIASVMPRFSDEELAEEYDLQDCPNCGSDAVGYDGTVPFLECFQCDHNWIP